MFMQQIEEYIQISLVGSQEQRADASLKLSALKSHPDAVSIGLNLLISSVDDPVRLFGGHMVRDFLQSGRPMSLEDAASLRQAVMGMVNSSLHGTQSSPGVLPPFLVNVLLYILSLCIKRDYPENWPTAFQDIMQLSQSLGWRGVEVIVKIMNEFEVEVVVFNEDRSRDEITHNTVIKDTMRATSVIPDIVRYLRDAIQSAIPLHIANSSDSTCSYLDIAKNAASCLAGLIGWIDINLVIVELYPMLRVLLEQGDGGFLRTEALVCIYEVVKKGMDPVLKADLLQRLDILPVLVKLLPRFQGSPLLYEVDESLMDTKMFHYRIAMVLDIMLVELLGCLIKFEEGLFPVKRTAFSTGRGRSVHATGSTSSAGAGVSEELCAVIPFVSQMLSLLVPEVINLLHHPVASIASSVSPSIDRLIQLYKSQKARESVVEEFLANNSSQPRWFLLQQDCTDSLLVGLWHQSQYPQDFELEDAVDDDADDDFLEAKVEIRRLLINSARVNPARFLQMVSCFMAELPQPLSKAPLPALDICLHALQALENNVLDTCPEIFNQLFAALTQQSDLAHHPHMLIQIAFLEFSLRHWKKLDDATLLHMALSIVQRIQSIVLGLPSQSAMDTPSSGSVPRRLRSNSFGSLNTRVPPKTIVIKLTHLAIKISEVYPEKWKLLLIMGLIVKDTIVLGTEAYMQSLATNPNRNQATTRAMMFPDVEVHLYEIIAVLLAFVASASSWQQFDVHQHGSLCVQLVSYLSAARTAESAPVIAQTTVTQVASLLPILSALPSTGNGSAGGLYHSQYIQPLQLQLLSLLGQHIHHHCHSILQQPPAQVAMFQATFEMLLAQHMRNMIALLERFHKQYTAVAASSSSSMSSMVSSSSISPVNVVSTGTSPGPMGSPSQDSATTEANLLPLMQQFSTLVTEILIAHSHSDVIRQRVYAFLRVMIVLMPNQNTFHFVQQILPMLLVDMSSPNPSSAMISSTNGHFCSSIEALVDLLDQLMTEFHHHSFHLVQSVIVPVVTTLWQRIEECLVPSTEAVSLAPDVTIPIKILLNLFLHASQHRLMAGLFPAAAAAPGVISLSQVLSWMVPIVQGFVPVSIETGLFVRSSRRIIKFTSFPLRRAVVVACGHLVQHFLLDSTTTSSTVTSPIISSSSPNSLLPSELQASQNQMLILEQFLLEQGLPSALLCLGSAPGTQMAMAQRFSTLNPISASGESNMEYEHIKINLQDAATQAFLSEVAGLLYLLVKVDHVACGGASPAGSAGLLWPTTIIIGESGAQLSVGIHGLSAQYLPWLLTQWLCWSPESMQLLCTTLYPASTGGVAMAMGPFREQFKQFARQYLG